jgi:AcrR family transcriptional regulator
VRTTSEKAQRAIAEAALSRFCKRGYLRANIEEIGVQTGLTSAAALRHFRSKADLLKVVVDPVRHIRAQLLVVRFSNVISAHVQISQVGFAPLAQEAEQ